MFSFLGIQQNQRPSSKNDDPKKASKGIEDNGIVVDKAQLPISPTGNSYQIEEDLAPSELSSSAYDPSYNQYLTNISNEHGVQSFDSMGRSNDPIMPQEGKEIPRPSPQESYGDPRQGAGAYDPRQPSPVAANGVVHAISYVTEAPEHGYKAGYEDDLSTLGDESIIRRGRQNQQKQQELKQKQLDHQEKQKQKKGKKYDKTKISKAHTRSTEEISPSSAGELSFSFSNVLDVHEKIPASSKLGYDITDDAREDREGDQPMLDVIVGAGDGGDDDSDFGAKKKAQESFFQRNKWVIIRFIIILSLFLLMAAAAVLVVSLLQMRKNVNKTDASIVGTGGQASNDAIATLAPEAPAPAPTLPFPPIFIPPDNNDVPDTTETSPQNSSTLPLETGDNVFTTEAVTDAPTETTYTTIETQVPTRSSTLAPTISKPLPVSESAETVTPTSTESKFEEIINSDVAEQTKIGTDLRFVIANFSPKSLPFLEDSESAQYKAFYWMTKDPNYWNRDISAIVQRWTLAILYYSTGGPNWKTELLPDVFAEGKSPWLSYSDECLWESSNQGSQGRVCDSDNNYFAIHLRSLGLKGTIPAELGLLSDHIRLLFFNDNELTGSLPSELGQLTSLEKINLQYNNLVGSLPSEIGLWGDLTIAAMGNNQFSGTIPSEMGSWNSVRTIGLENNNLNGTLPRELSQMNLIEKISVEKNFLSGTIPYDFNYMYQLTSLTLQSNDFTGEMQWGLCPGCYSVETLKADCQEIKCDCCTQCFDDDRSIPEDDNSVTLVSDSVSRVGGL